MPTPFSSDDLGRVFDARTLTRGRTLVLFGAVEVSLDGDVITAAVDDLGIRQTSTMTPSPMGARTVFNSRCSCRHPGCVHLAAAALAALDRFPVLRKAPPKGLLSLLSTEPMPERQRLVFDLSAGTSPYACFVSASLIGQQSGRVHPTTPRLILADLASSEAAREIAGQLGGEAIRTGVAATDLPAMLGLLVRSGLARWQASGRRLIAGVERIFDANTPPKLPPKSAVLLGNGGPWYVDATTGATGRIRLRQPARPAMVRSKPQRRRVEIAGPAATLSERVIVEQPVTPVLRLRKLQCPDEFGRMQLLDALTLDFDYGGVADRAPRTSGSSCAIEGPAGPSSCGATGRRGRVVRHAAPGRLRADAHGRRPSRQGPPGAGVPRPRCGGKLAALRRRTGAGTAGAGLAQPDRRRFRPALGRAVGSCDMRVGDAEPGGFSLDFGIEIDGARHPLLPILTASARTWRHRAAQIVDGELVTSLDDGRILKLPAERIARLLAVMDDLIDGAPTAASARHWCCRTARRRPCWSWRIC